MQKTAKGRQTMWKSNVQAIQKRYVYMVRICSRVTNQHFSLAPLHSFTMICAMCQKWVKFFHTNNTSCSVLYLSEANVLGMPTQTLMDKLCACEIDATDHTLSQKLKNLLLQQLHVRLTMPFAWMVGWMNDKPNLHMCIKSKNQHTHLLPDDCRVLGLVCQEQKVV